MFKKITTKIKKQMSNTVSEVMIDVAENTKGNVIEKIDKTVDNKLPIILGAITVGVTLSVFIKTNKKISTMSTIIINNYYF